MMPNGWQPPMMFAPGRMPGMPGSGFNPNMLGSGFNPMLMVPPLGMTSPLIVPANNPISSVPLLTRGDAAAPPIKSGGGGGIGLGLNLGGNSYLPDEPQQTAVFVGHIPLADVDNGFIEQLLRVSFELLVRSCFFALRATNALFD